MHKNKTIQEKGPQLYLIESPRLGHLIKFPHNTGAAAVGHSIPHWQRLLIIPRLMVCPMLPGTIKTEHPGFTLC